MFPYSCPIFLINNNIGFTQSLLQTPATKQPMCGSHSAWIHMYGHSAVPQALAVHAALDGAGFRSTEGTASKWKGRGK